MQSAGAGCFQPLWAVGVGHPQQPARRAQSVINRVIQDALDHGLGGRTDGGGLGDESWLGRREDIGMSRRGMARIRMALAGCNDGMVGNLLLMMEDADLMG